MPDREFQEKALYDYEMAYRKAIWTLPDDFDTEQSFDRALRRLDMTSSPGYPYCKEATTNGAWLRWNGFEVDPIQRLRLWADVQALIDEETADNPYMLRVFIKEEPHKAAKVEEGRWRLIIASPLHVQVWWHMLFDYSNDAQIENAYYIPSQHGLVLPYGGWRMFYQQWTSLALTQGVDKSAWDWTYPIWLIELDLEAKSRLGRGRRMKEWRRHADRAFRLMFRHPMIIFSSGVVLRQVVPGVMKSGCVTTINGNGSGQTLGHLVSCAEASVRHSIIVDIHPIPRSVGDDTLQHQKHEFLLEIQKEYGFLIKSISDTLEFVGHEFTPSGPRPLYWLKHLARLSYTQDDNLPTFLDAMARMYCHVPEFEFWDRVAMANGTPLPMSQSGYIFWYDYEQR